MSRVQKFHPTLKCFFKAIAMWTPKTKDFDYSPKSKMKHFEMANQAS
jgi:hypothetical protein